MNKKLIVLLVLFNSNLIITSDIMRPKKEVTQKAILDEKLEGLADRDMPLNESLIDGVIAQITISNISDEDKQEYFKKLSQGLTARGLGKTVTDIQAISKKYESEGTQKDIELFMKKLSGKSLTKKAFYEILSDFDTPTLAVARLVENKNVIDKTKELLTKIKEIAVKNKWPNIITSKEQDFLKAANLVLLEKKFKNEIKSIFDLNNSSQTIKLKKLKELARASTKDLTKKDNLAAFKVAFFNVSKFDQGYVDSLSPDDLNFFKNLSLSEYREKITNLHKAANVEVKKTLWQRLSKNDPAIIRYDQKALKAAQAKQAVTAKQAAPARLTVTAKQAAAQARLTVPVSARR